MQKFRFAGPVALCASLALATAGVTLAIPLAALHESAQQPSDAKPQYTLAEYNAFQACLNEKVPATQTKCFEDFFVKYPESTLSIYSYRPMYLAYNQLKNYSKMIEYADKIITLGEKAELGSRLEAQVARAQAAFFLLNQRNGMTVEQMTKAREETQNGLKLLEAWTKPEGMTDEQFAAQKKSLGILFNSVGGFAALQAKDYRNAVELFKGSLGLEPNDGVGYYRLGIAYLQQEPPLHMDGFWAVARAVALKIPGEAQVRSYLRNQMLRYQQTQCEPELDKQMNELLALAASSPERPADFKVASAAELEVVRANAAGFLDEMRAGGDRAKIMWLAVCGLEFPDVAVKVISVEPNDEGALLNVFRAATAEEMEAATTANMQVKVEGQPEAARVEKDNFVRFTGSLARYTPEPFMIYWEKAKVHAEDIPEAKAPPAKKAPAKKAPTKRPPAKKTPAA